MVISLLIFVAIAIILYFVFTPVVFINWLIGMIIIKCSKQPKRTTPSPAQLLRWLVWPIGFYRHSTLSRRWKYALTVMAPLSLTTIIISFESIAWAVGYPFPVITGRVAHSVHSMAPETPSFKLVDCGFNGSAFPDWSESFYFEFRKPLSDEFKATLDDPSNGWVKKTSNDGIYYEKSHCDLIFDEFIDHAEHVKIFPDKNKGVYIYKDY